MIAFLVKTTNFYFLFLFNIIPLNQIRVICNINISDQNMLTLHQEDFGKEVFKEFSLLYMEGEAETIKFVTWDSSSGQAV